jgi:hypothetical protein
MEVAGIHGAFYPFSNGGYRYEVSLLFMKQNESRYKATAALSQ